MSDKFSRVIKIAKIGAWAAFGCLCFYILSFPFLFILIAFAAMDNPGIGNFYIGLALFCVIYLTLFFLIQFVIAVYPWWRARKKITKTLIAFFTAALLVTITTVSIVVPQRHNYLKVTNHFETNWKINLPEDATLKYNKSRSFGFVGGHDELAYAVFELKTTLLNNELLTLMPNGICNLTSWNQMKIDWQKDKFPGLTEKAYAKLYFEQLLSDFPMQIPDRFLPDWSSGIMHWGLQGAMVSNYNQVETDACLFAIFTPSNRRITLYEYLVADH